MAERGGVQDPNAAAYAQLETGYKQEALIRSLHANLAAFAMGQVRRDERIEDFFVFPKINHEGEIDEIQQANAAKIDLYLLRQILQEKHQEQVLDNPIILAIMRSGQWFGKAIQQELRLTDKQLLYVHKYDTETEIVPVGDPFVTSAYSYSAEAKRDFRVPMDEIFALIDQSTGLLIVDDFMARGAAMGSVKRKLNEYDIDPSAGLVYVSKNWQRGKKRMEMGKRGFPVCAALELESKKRRGKRREIFVRPIERHLDANSENLINAWRNPHDNSDGKYTLGNLHDF